MHKVPILVIKSDTKKFDNANDNDKSDTITLPESQAIMRYLCTSIQCKKHHKDGENDSEEVSAKVPDHFYPRSEIRRAFIDAAMNW